MKDIYIMDKPCDFCQEGDLRFVLCDDLTTVVLICCECEWIYLDPSDLSLDLSDKLNCSVSFADGARYATLEEINKAGFGEYVFTND